MALDKVVSTYYDNASAKTRTPLLTIGHTFECLQ